MRGLVRHLLPGQSALLTSTFRAMSSKRYFLYPARHPDCERGIDVLAGAADAVVRGDLDAATELVLESDLPSLTAWFDEAQQTSRLLRELGRQRERAPADLKVEAKDKTTTEMKLLLGERDGWRCRFCQCRVVATDARNLLRSVVPELRWGRPNSAKHGALVAHAYSHDHVLPRSWGGTSAMENLVTACYPCQFSRVENRLDHCGIEDPFTRPPIVDEWDGLRRVVGSSSGRRFGDIS